MSEPALRDTFGKYLVEIGKTNSNLVVLDCDLSSSTKTSEFAKTFPERFFNVGIAEQNMLGIAMGFSISGKIPLVSGFTIFTIGRAWEFIRMACHDNLNLKIVTTHGGIVGEDGSTHNSFEDLSLMAALPNLKILIPADNIELVQILDYALKNEGPYYIRLPRGSFPKIHDNRYKFSLGKPDVIKKGNDICLIGTGYGSILALEAAPIIEKKLNISIKVINLPNIKPIDEKCLIKEIFDLNGIVIIEEHNVYCGVGSIIARIISTYHPIPIKFIGINDCFGQSGERSILLNEHGLNLKNIMMNVNTLIKKLE